MSIIDTQWDYEVLTHDGVVHSGELRTSTSRVVEGTAHYLLCVCHIQCMDVCAIVVMEGEWAHLYTYTMGVLSYVCSMELSTYVSL